MTDDQTEALREQVADALDKALVTWTYASVDEMPNAPTLHRSKMLALADGALSALDIPALTARAEQAWDEGYQSGWTDRGKRRGDEARNPYVVRPDGQEDE